MTEREKLLDEMKKGDNYEDTRQFILSKLRQKTNNNILNFHYTPGPGTHTKEEIWAEMEKAQKAIYNGHYTTMDFGDSRRPVHSNKKQTDVKELVKKL